MTTLFTGGSIHSLREGAVDWLLVEDGRCIAMGNGSPPSAKRVVDLDGAILVPAFRDAHVHLPTTGLYATGFDFRGERSVDAILSAYRSRAGEPESSILFGGNFEDPLDRALVGSDLDAAVGPRPALLARADMHSCIVSTALLRQLDLEMIEGVDRDSDGRPTGYLREQAAATAWKWFDNNLTAEQQRDAVNAAVRLAYSKGIAEVHEMFVVEWRGWDSARAFAEIVEPVALDVQLYLGTPEVSRVKELGLPRIGGDFFLDGSFGSHTAWLSEPYTSPPPSGSGSTGISYRADEDLYTFFRDSQRAGLQVGVHAIGDAAIEQCIATWERVAEDEGAGAVRAKGHRIEHFECASNSHMRRAAALGIRPSIQPAFDRYWGGEQGLYAERIGIERALQMNRFRSMIAAGLTLAAGSDSTVTPLDPFLQMASLRAHHVRSESVDAITALEMHTLAPALLVGHEETKGDIVEGAQADLALLDRDPLNVDAEELLKTEVLGTWIAGRRVWPENEADAR